MLLLASYRRHNLFGLPKYKLPIPHRSRSPVSSIWLKEGEGDFFVVQASCDHEDCPITPSFVRIGVTKAFRFSQNADNTTSVEIVGTVNLNGHLHQWANDIVTVPQL